MQPSHPTLCFSGRSGDSLLRNLLSCLAGEAEQLLEWGGRESPDARRVTALHGALLDAADACGAAGAIRRALTPLLAVPRGEHDAGVLAFYRDLARLHQDLYYLALLQDGGIAALNKELGRLLDSLRSPKTDRARSAQLVRQINDVCRRAIYLFPDHATAVSIEFALDDRAFEDQARRYLGRTGSNREELTALWDHSGRPGGDAGRPVVHLPLPYLFAADTEHARRQARRASWEDFVFVPRRLVRRADVMPRPGSTEVPLAEVPAVLLVRTAFDRDLGLSRTAQLLASEIVGMGFTRENHYLRAFSTTIRDEVARPRLDPLTHYLLFRDFGDIGQNPSLARALDIPLLAERSLFAPEYATGLLDVADDESGRQWLERGFGYLALVGRGHGLPSLLRFGDAEVTYAAATLQTAKHSPLQRALYRAALDPDDPLRAKSAGFTGAEAIIAELMRVPVAPRRFRPT